MEVVVPVGQLNDIEVHERLIALRREIEIKQAEESALYARWDAGNVWSDNGSKSSAHRYARETGLSINEAKRIRTRARKLLTMPVTMLAFAVGDLTTARVDLLVRTNQPHLAELFARDEEMLVDNVKKLSFADACRFLKYWENHADPDGAEDKAKRQYESRGAHCSKTFDDTVDLQAIFEPIGGEIFADELARLEKQLFEEDWAEAKAIYGDEVSVDKLKRTPRQRRADALVLMATRSASAAGGSKRPLLNIVLGIDAFKNVCELASGTVLTPGQVIPVLKDAHIESMVFDGPSKLVDIKYRRLFTGAVRRALEVVQRHCQHESECDVPAKDCQGDHDQSWYRGGRSEFTNGKMMCGFHNRAKGSGPP